MKQPAFNALLKQAAAKLDAFDFGEALKLYNQANNQKPGNAAAQMGMAVVLNRTGESANALVILQKLWEAVQAKEAKVKKETQAEIMAQVSLALEQLGYPIQAQGALHIAQQLHPTAKLALRLAALKNRKITQISNPLAALLAHAREKASISEWKQAASSYQAALVINADSDEALNGLADVLRQTGHLEHALTLIQKAILLQPHTSSYLNTLGLIYLAKNENEKALKALRRSIKIDPQNAHAICNQGVVLRRLGRLPEAVRAYKAAIAVVPQMAEAWNNLGNVYRDMHDKDQATTHYRKALGLKPGYADAQRNLDELAVTKKTAAKKAASNNVATKRPAAKKTNNPSTRNAANVPAKTTKAKTRA